jgi:hypothetical protein
MFLAREVEARNFVLNIGHLGRREPVVQPNTSSQGRLRMKRMILLFVVSAILVLALAVPAMAKTFPPPGGGGENQSSMAQ